MHDIDTHTAAVLYLLTERPALIRYTATGIRPVTIARSVLEDMVKQQQTTEVTFLASEEAGCDAVLEYYIVKPVPEEVIEFYASQIAEEIAEERGIEFDFVPRQAPAMNRDGLLDDIDAEAYNVLCDTQLKKHATAERRRKAEHKKAIAPIYATARAEIPTHYHPHYLRVYLTVKATPVPVDDLICQIALCRPSASTAPGSEMQAMIDGLAIDDAAEADSLVAWVVATTYPLAQDEMDRLKAEGVCHVMLDGDFDAYLANQQ